MDIILNNCMWSVKGFWPYVPLLGKSLELDNELMGATDWIDATVPGGVHHDLLRAGLIEDPYFEQNSLKCEWVENRWWMYRTYFHIDKNFIGKRLTLSFKGVDYKAHFYLNKIKLGEHEGMYEAVSFDITDKVEYKSENELVVLLENAPHEMSQIGYTSMTSTQKSRFGYKWDFSTRLVNIGLWDDVILKVTGDFSIDDTFISTDVENEVGSIKVACSIMGETGESCVAKLFIDYNGDVLHTLEEQVLLQCNINSFMKSFSIPDPQLWYPNGAGVQPLYGVKIELYHNNELSDEQEYHTGIRKLEYKQNQDSPKDSLPYTVVINEVPIYIKGVNLVPFDHLYGNVTRETYEKYIQLIKRANINMVRIWGGGIIEKEYFYHLCDVNGIMVWQEFIQSSSGINNMPSIDPHFMELLKAAATQAVKLKRNHVCHTIWSGGNELMDENNTPVTYGHPNIIMLKDIVSKYDSGKLFLPTSASGLNEYLDVKKPGKNHDVHGSWKYEGTENHYHMYNCSDSLFHSEFGVDGCSSVASLKRFLGEDHLKVTNMKDNMVWRHHGEWWDTLSRDQEIFGKCASLEQFAKASQFIQAEGLRYIVESNRRRKFKNSGSIVWQLNEPWPNVSCTSLVEYSRVPKMAYYWLSKAYAPIHASLVYDKLFYKQSEEFKGEVFVHNSLDAQKLTIAWELLDITGDVIRMEKTQRWIPSNSASNVSSISIMIPQFQRDIFFVRIWIYDSSGKECCQNLYIFSQMEKEIFSPLLHLEKGTLQIEKMGTRYKVKNAGTVVCLFVHGIETTGNECIFIEDNYSCIFPGEEHIFQVHPINNVQYSNNTDFLLTWEYLNCDI